MGWLWAVGCWFWAVGNGFWVVGDKMGEGVLVFGV